MLFFATTGIAAKNIDSATIHFVVHLLLECSGISLLKLSNKMKSSIQSKWEEIFKNGPSKICGRQPLKYFTSFILEYFVSNILDSKLLITDEILMVSNNLLFPIHIRLT